MSPKQFKGVVTFDPAKGIPSLAGKVILVTGGRCALAFYQSTSLISSLGTAGLGRESVIAFAAHDPAHIYFTGRNASAADSLIAELKLKYPNVELTFIEMDLSSLRSVKESIVKTFNHDHLDILMNNAGIIAKPAVL